jgi:hypothetical protein
MATNLNRFFRRGRLNGACWSDHHGFRGNEVGSLQPNTVFCPCPKSIAASCATSASPTTSAQKDISISSHVLPACVAGFQMKSEKEEDA